LKLQHDGKVELSKKNESRFDLLRDDILSMSESKIKKVDQKKLMVKVINILEALTNDAKSRGK
tara:strand:+ start:1004 stop:1192 length:189 start_codon:yes stop_codon:yes gene_type:complete